MTAKEKIANIASTVFPRASVYEGERTYEDDPETTIVDFELDQAPKPLRIELDKASGSKQRLAGFVHVDSELAVLLGQQIVLDIIPIGGSVRFETENGLAAILLWLRDAMMQNVKKIVLACTTDDDCGKEETRSDASSA